LILSLRYLLQSENKRRDGEQRDETYDDVYVTQGTEDGIKSEKRVDKVLITIASKKKKISVIADYAISNQAFLDLTDIQNRDFRYTL